MQKIRFVLTFLSIGEDPVNAIILLYMHPVRQRGPSKIIMCYLCQTQIPFLIQKHQFMIKIKQDRKHRDKKYNKK